MSRKGLEQPSNIFPHSISAISNNPDLSAASETGIFEDRKLKQEPLQYKIKVKKPQQPYYVKSPHGLGQHSRVQQKTVNYELQLSEASEHQVPILAQQIPLKQDITGYEICKMSFSQEQIIEAFKVIDVNKDEMITEEDIVFFLEYIKEPYTKEQVKEMIEMVSSDKKKVTLSDFKKIGKGSIIPFADIKIPTEETKQKKQIYTNIKNNPQLYEQNPSLIINASKSEIISRPKFQQSKKVQKSPELQSIKLINDEEEIDLLMEKLQLLREEEFRERKEKFASVGMVNAAEIVRNYGELIKEEGLKEDRKYLGWKQIARVLQVSEKQAKGLYSEEKLVLGKKVVLQAIAFSPLNKIKRFEMGMNIMLSKKTINFKEFYFLLQVLKGKDESGSLKKKLLTILSSKNISREKQMDKFYALELLNSFSYEFIF